MADLSTVLAESQLYNALYGEIGQEEQASATAAALNLQSKGMADEATQYAIAGNLSTQNAETELVSGQIQQFQTMRQLTKTLGAQTAGVAGAGFQSSGSAIDLARSSLQQGLLQSQVEGVNSTLAAGGYFQQAASSAAETTAATTASNVAAANSKAATNVASLSMQAATNTKNFMSMIPGFDPNNPFGPPATGPNLAANPIGGPPPLPNQLNGQPNPATPKFGLPSTNSALPQIPAAITPNMTGPPGPNSPSIPVVA